MSPQGCRQPGYRRLRTVVRLGGLLCALALPALAGAAKVAPITSFTIPDGGAEPWGIVTGPDGNLWFTENGTNAVGRLTPRGTFTTFPLPDSAREPLGIAAGPRATVWVACHNGAIVQVTMAGKMRVHAVPSDRTPYDITAGPGGAMWFTEQAPTTGGGDTSTAIGKFTPAGKFKEYPIARSGSNPLAITAAGGAVWFTDGDAGAIGTVSAKGKVREFRIPGGHGLPYGIAAGPDGALWFADQNRGQLGRITTSGKITELAIHASSVITSLAAGPDHALWIADHYTQALWRSTTTGRTTKVLLPPGEGTVVDVTAGPDGALWYTNELGTIGRVLPSAATSR